MFCWLDPHTISSLRVTSRVYYYHYHEKCLYCNGYHYSLFLSDLQHHRPIQSYPTTYIYIYIISLYYTILYIYHISYIYIHCMTYIKIYNTYVCGHIMIASDRWSLRAPGKSTPPPDPPQQAALAAREHSVRKRRPGRGSRPWRSWPLRWKNGTFLARNHFGVWHQTWKTIKDLEFREVLGHS